jgi:2-polyprenyl-3-methyl-5-hydroxy-6-metoxy-1,4-benzoquinol methylase
MNRDLNPIEIDFVEFIAAREGISVQEAESRFCKIRKRFGYFKSKRFIQSAGTTQQVCNFIYNSTTAEKTEAEILEIYRLLAPLHIFVFISYSYPKNISKRIREAWRMFKKKEYTRIIQFGQRYLNQKVQGKEGTVDLILKHAISPPVVVDYGCGMGYRSLEIARREQASKVYLVDIESIIQEFTVFRFKKYKVDFEVIKVTKDNVYPSLPEHNVCLADEVMEHVITPLRVYKNIHDSMVKDGLLFGNFHDHSRSRLHVSPNLSELREAIHQSYETVESKIYKKMR